MHRREFMLSIVLAAIRPGVCRAKITRFDEGSPLEIGCLHCAVEEQSVTVDVYVEHRWPNGRVEVRRMVPTETLQRRLNALGLSLELQGHPIYPSLVGRVEHRPAPDALGRLLAAVLEDSDWRSLYAEP